MDPQHAGVQIDRYCGLPVVFMHQPAVRGCPVDWPGPHGRFTPALTSVSFAQRGQLPVAIAPIEMARLRFLPNPLILCLMSSAIHTAAHLPAASPAGLLLLYLLR